MNVSQEVSHILQDVRTLGMEEGSTLYGIEFLSENIEGQVRDVTYERTFDTLAEWAAFCVEQDHVEFDDQRYGHFDEEEF